MGPVPSPKLLPGWLLFSNHFWLSLPPGEVVGLVPSGKEWDKRNLGLLQLCYHTTPITTAQQPANTQKLLESGIHQGMGIL